MINILLWCDEKLSHLKQNNVEIKNGIPQLSKDDLYTDVPKKMTTFAYRNDVSDSDKKETILTFFMYEEKLWPRLKTIDDDIKIMSEYGGISGFDLSPCIGMLKPRQRMSILINAIYSSYCALKGVKVLANYRAGDFSTVNLADYFPNNNQFIVGNLGCNRNGFKNYGYYMLIQVLRKKNPSNIYFFGGISKKEAEEYLNTSLNFIITFPDRRNRVRNDSKAYIYYLKNEKVVKELFEQDYKGGCNCGC
ncbi:protein of unknown function [Lachnospiraceae bacterium RM5]|nr:protein of unknown function [Lachnospiraceae bacterium RM5]